ncbi:hypothetical protein LINGRAHAP2_LOCUS18611 [Linum grandiflorum]
MLHHLPSSSSSSAAAKYPANLFTNTRPGSATTSRLLLTVVRAHLADEGNSGGSSDVVEANMSVLKERIQQVQIKERMSLTYPAGHRPPFSRMTTDQPISTASSSPRPINIRVSNNYGWNYGEANMVKSRRRKNDGGDVVLQMLKVIGLVSSTVGITCLSGTGLLCLVSLLTHDFSHQF